MFRQCSAGRAITEGTAANRDTACRRAQQHPRLSSAASLRLSIACCKRLRASKPEAQKAKGSLGPPSLAAKSRPQLARGRWRPRVPGWPCRPAAAGGPRGTARPGMAGGSHRSPALLRVPARRRPAAVLVLLREQLQIWGGARVAKLRAAGSLRPPCRRNGIASSYKLLGVFQVVFRLVFFFYANFSSYSVFNHMCLSIPANLP